MSKGLTLGKLRGLHRISNPNGTLIAAITALKRVADVNTLVRERGTPWSARYGLTMETLRSIRATEGWHTRYDSGFGLSAGALSSKAVPGDVY